ncbi:hypothetical protein J6590_003435 [Homalodisca vitripennis]|nr:hypothetical protein J6590_003435 [Homalodisca vitripennis]
MAFIWAKKSNKMGYYEFLPHTHHVQREKGVVDIVLPCFRKGFNPSHHDTPTINVTCLINFNVFRWSGRKSGPRLCAADVQLDVVIAGVQGEELFNMEIVRQHVKVG